MTQASVPHPRGFPKTLRTDTWWLEPALVAVSLAVFFGWLTISIFLEGWAYEIGPYLSPVYEPKLWESEHWYASPAFVVLLGPVPFRATCYYYRRAYYRSFFLSPPACAVGDVAEDVQGRIAVPVHRPEPAPAVHVRRAAVHPHPLVGAAHSFYNRGLPRARTKAGASASARSSSCVNAFLLMMYTFSCHSLRHFVGGGLNCFSCTKWTRTRKRVWDYVTAWNAHHRCVGMDQPAS